MEAICRQWIKFSVRAALKQENVNVDTGLHWIEFKGTAGTLAKVCTLMSVKKENRKYRAPQTDNSTLFATTGSALKIKFKLSPVCSL